MPNFIKTDKDEQLWNKAKEVASKEGKTDDDYITNIWKKMKHEEALSEMKNILNESKSISKQEFFDSSAARDITDTEEMLRASISAEQDASALYREYAKKTPIEYVKRIMLSVADEEDVHIGEFQQALETLSNKYLGNVNKGKEEVVDNFSGYIDTSETSVHAPELDEYDLYEFYIGCIKESEHTDDFEEMITKVISNLKSQPEYYTSNLKDDDFVEYQVPSGSNINVGRMIKNMSKAHVPKFDTKRNMADRFKVMFKMPTPKDDMNAANQNRESFEMKESFTIVGKFTEEKDAVDLLKNLLQKKRNAQMLTDRDGKFIIIVEQ